MGAAHDTGEKGGPSGVSRTAEEPGQTVNVDLCFIPAAHETDHKLPAVSGSSGRLVVERGTADAPGEPTWPGRVFEDRALDYADAMRAFVAASVAAALPPDAEQTPEQEAAGQRKAAQRELRQEEEAVRAARRQVRTQRRLEDAVWQVLVADRRADAARADADTSSAGETQWQHLRAQRRATLEQRHGDDTVWRQRRQALRQERDQGPGVRTWIAVLVLTDNCTRQCLGLPLFVAGARITAAEVTAALRALLPPELQFLISDRGTHFTAHDLADLTDDRDFVHVLIARHRPESNGIAERFVRTLKEWLADKSWVAADEVAALLACFLAEYNDRPHQGLALPGLSPNEFAQRLWLL